MAKVFEPLTESLFWQIVDQTEPHWLSSDVSCVLEYDVTKWEEINSTTVRVEFETLECEDPDDDEKTYSNKFICLMAFDADDGWHIDADHIKT